MSRLSIAYLFWAFGGLFGLHHIYMGRLTHGIFFNITLGFCGLGWIYDFFHIPTYVKQANSDPIYLGLLRKKTKERPPASIPRALSVYVSAYCFAHLSLTLLGFFEPIDARIGEVLANLPMWWVLATSVVQIIGILVGCLLINSIGGQRTVSKSYLLMPIVIGTACDVLLAMIANARIMIICRALFPTLFYLRSCEWLPTCTSPKPPYFTSFSRFSSLFAQYLIATLICFSLISGSMYFYCDVFVDNNGAIEYSDTNYGVGFSHESFFSKLTWNNPSFRPEHYPMNNLGVVDGIHDRNDDTDRVDSTAAVNGSSGHQPQYSYTQFKDELKAFYNTNIQQQQQDQSQQDQSQQPSNPINTLSLAYSYRFRDILRNIYFSSILKPVHSEINYYNVNYSPGTDPLFHRFYFPSVSPINLIDTIITQSYYKAIFIARCSYYFYINASAYVAEHGISALITELDIIGLSWANSFITYLNHGNPIVAGKGTVPYTTGQIDEMKDIVGGFVMRMLQTTGGDVTQLRYWQQKAIYDAIIAYGRLNPQRL